jgi:hypothetical protein
MPHAGVKDPQTVVAGGGRASAPKILGVQIFELGNVITRSGFITEVFRTDWPVVSISVRQVNWVQLNAGAPILDALASEVRRANLPLSLCGVARPDDASLPVSADLVLAQFPRLGATGAWISRSFFRGAPSDWNLREAIAAVRQCLTEWASASPESLERARADLAEQARAFASSPETVRASRRNEPRPRTGKRGPWAA